MDCAVDGLKQLSVESCKRAQAAQEDAAFAMQHPVMDARQQHRAL